MPALAQRKQPGGDEDQQQPAGKRIVGDDLEVSVVNPAEVAVGGLVVSGGQSAAVLEL